MAATVAQTAGSPGQLPIPPPWTPKLDKLFEKALAIYDGDSPDRWEKIASKLPGVDPTEVKKHYDRLIEDLNSIETGRVALPNYHKSVGLMSSSDEDSPTSRKPVHGGHHSLGGSNANATNATSLPSGKAPSSKASDPERRKGIPWSEEEHRLFLLGLAKFGKGDWRSISRNFVISRTPTQVASHAQKYFIRLNSINNKDKRRSSIHDITSVNDGDSLPQSPGPITGLPSPGAQWPRSGLQGASMYDMGGMGGPDQAMGGQMLMTPTGHPHHVPYGHVPVMQGPPMAMQHMSYPMPQSANA
ncbi:hypothetical protein Mapa_000720 [Marchantia paleacea]|nr:hypothetical protein Mapa_000720 [Marchantia paleacea]